MAGMEQAEKVADWLVIVGALNIGLTGVGNFVNTNLDVLNLIFGGFAGGVVANVVWVLIGLSALLALKKKLGK